MSRREKFQIGNICHLYNRGSKKDPIFFDIHDYLRFIEILDEFNWEKNLRLREIREIKKLPASLKMDFFKKGKRLVKIYCFCLMENHFHLAVKQILEDGISLFMKKVNTGYAYYLNKKYNKSGYVFQGRYKSVRVINDSQLVHLTKYIHLNPIKIISIKKGIDISEALREYPWSSYCDFIGLNKYPHLCKSDIINHWGGVDEYKKSINIWGKRKIDDLRIKAGF